MIQALTEEQTAWIAEVLASRPCFLSARAGTGKTSTIIAATQARVNKGLSAPALIAFNKAIAQELATRVPFGTKVFTLHSLGYATLRTFAPGVKLNNSKTFELMKLNPIRNTASKPRRWKDTYALVGLLKAAGYIPEGSPKIFKSHSLVDASELEKLATVHQLFDADIELATRVLLQSLEVFMTQRQIDFSDMIYLPWALGLVPSLPEITLIDEAQDLSALDLAFLRRSSSKLFPVGDPYQSIYGWRGAIPEILQELRLPEFPLTKSWRCAQEIIAYAKTFVPDIISGRSEAGTCEYLEAPPDFLAEAPAVVISRTNGELIELALPLLRAGVPLSFLGKNFGDELYEIVKGFKANSEAALRIEARSYFQERIAQYPQMEMTFKTQMKVILSMLDVYPNKPALLSALSNLFTDTYSPSVWTFATVHATKGLEFPKVYLALWKQKPYDSDSEHRNLCYVGSTRARDDLYTFELEPEQLEETRTSELRSQSKNEDNFLF